MKILLTGATGFVGSYCMKYSCYQETLIPFSFQNDTIAHFDFSHIDTVIHLAALVHQMSGADPKEYQEINATKTVQFAQKAKDNGVKHFIFMSTVKVYGEESDTIYTETTPCNPRDDYGKSKLLAEQELQKLNDKNFTVSIIRTPIVYGSGVKANIKSLITLIQTIPVLPFGNTQNQRSMVYVGNLCALIECIVKNKTGGIFLACDNTPLSTTEFIQQIADVLGKKIFLVNIPLFNQLLKLLKPAFYQRLFGNLMVDNTLTKKRLGFHNPYSTEEGIKNMLQGTTL